LEENLDMVDVTGVVQEEYAIRTETLFLDSLGTAQM
jgi:hypothetical protein